MTERQDMRVPLHIAVAAKGYFSQTPAVAFPGGNQSALVGTQSRLYSEQLHPKLSEAVAEYNNKRPTQDAKRRS